MTAREKNYQHPLQNLFANSTVEVVNILFIKVVLYEILHTALNSPWMNNHKPTATVNVTRSK